MQHTRRNIFSKIVPGLLFLVTGLLCSFHSNAQSVSWYLDSDGDGWGNPNVVASSATQLPGYVLNNLDCNDNSFNNTAWNRTGTSFSQYNATQISIAIDASGTPYVGYNDNTTSGSVQKYSGGTWAYTGSQNFTGAQPTYTSLAINSSGTPYMAYNDGYQASVMKYNGSSWVYVGSQDFTPGGATYTSLVLDASSTPYVAYSDAYYLYGNKATVMKYNGSSWVDVGPAGFTSGVASYTSLAINSSGTLYCAYADGAHSNKVTVMKYSASTWSIVGSAGFSAGAATYVSLAIDDGGTPYVIYNDGGNSNKATVMKYNGSSWATVGAAGFSAGAATYTSIVIDTAKTPYVAYSDGGNSNKATVMTYDGTNWVAVVGAGITPGTASYVDITLDPNGVPYIAFEDANNKLSVMNLAPVINFPTAPTVSASPAISCSSGSVTLSITGGTLNDGIAWQWYSGSCGGTSVGSGTSISVSTSSTTTYFARGENSCPSSDGLCGFVTATVKPLTTWYRDLDGDGWGNPAVTQTTCLQPTGYVANSLDCNDAVVTSTQFYDLGGGAANTSNNSWTSLALDNTNTPYVGFYESFNNGSVMKYTSSGWSYVGSAKFTSGAVQYASLAIDGNNTPYLGYQDAFAGASVMKYNGSSWVYVGTQNFSAAGATYTSLAIDPYNTPYIAYNDAYFAYGNKATVMKYNGSSWVAVGSPGMTAGVATYISLAIDGGGTPYIAFADGANSSKVTVMEYAGGNWSIVGSAGFSASTATYVSMAIDGNGTPYVVYSDAGSSSKATVMKYNGSSWAVVGSAGFTSGQANYTSIAIDGSNNPYVAYSDVASSGKATVMKYSGGSWAVYGAADFSAGSASYASLAIDAYGIPIVAMQDASTSNKTYVMKAGPVATSPTTPAVSATLSTVTCGNPTTLSATGTLNGAGTWYWYSGSCGGTFVGTGTSISVSPTATTTYYARGDGGCLTTPGSCGNTTITVTAGAPFVASITGSSNACIGVGIPLSDATPGGVWSSSSAAKATVNSSTGVVTGVATGSVTIAYTLTNACGTTIKTLAMTVNTSPSPITGTMNACEGATSTLSDITTLGTWTSSNTAVATVATATRVVTGVTAGTALISYTLSTGCYDTATYTVKDAPSAIGGNTSVCVGATTDLSNTVSGGVWSSGTTTMATISTSGVVSGVAAGTPLVGYKLGDGCATSITVTVNAKPAGITGTLSACEGASSTILDVTSGGVWSSSNTTVATANSGTINGVNAGTTTIIYAISATGCSTSATFTVNNAPSAITGNTTVCTGVTTALTDNDAGGVWSSGTTTHATINTSGVVTGVAAGTSIIAYKLGNGCAASITTTVIAGPSAITGTMKACEGSTSTLGDVTTLGTWTSSNTSVATVNTSTKVVTGITAGTTIISYTLANGCYDTTVFTVNNAPAAITGTTIVCVAATTALTDNDAGGTWASSATAKATVGSGTGVVTGVASGSTTITYTLTNGCVAATTVTVNPIPAAITGTTHACTGATSTLNDATASGTWTSSNSDVATVNTSTKVVSGVTAGTTIISYTLGTGCYDTTVFTVNQAPSALPAGTLLCMGFTTTLSDAFSGGTWASSATAKATVGSSSGIVTPVAAGATTITYSLPGSCTTVTSATVNTSPLAITGLTSVCNGSTRTLSDVTTLGTWSSNNTSVATIATGTRVVSSVSAGTTIISYTLADGCFDTTTFTVNAQPTPITDTTTVCMGSTTILTNSVTGGTWSSSVTTKATINSTSGLVTPVAAGTTTITYTMPGGCFTTTLVTVNSSPSSITGTTSVCNGSTRTLSDVTTLGTWSSNNTSVATVATSTRVVSSVSAGTAIISYTLADGCFDTTTFTVFAQPTPITDTTTVCMGGTTTLTNSITGGTWSSSVTTKATINSSTGLVLPVATGTTTITYTTPGSCSTTTLLTVAPIPALTSATNSGPICAGAPLTLTANGASNVTGYSWSGPASITNATTETATVTTTTTAANGTYTVTVNNGSGAGCFINYTTTATVKATPSAAPGSNSPICAGGTVTLAANPGSNTSVYKWSGSNLSSTTIQNPTATPATTNTYSLTVTDGSGNAGCSPTTVYTTAVTVSVLPTAAPTNNGPSCNGSSVTLFANPGGSANTYKWSGPNLSSTTIQNPTATPTVTAVYSLTVTYSTNPGCSPGTIYTTTVTVSTGNTWLGTTSGDWLTAANWCGGIPTTTTVVTIPSGTTYSPTISTGTASVKNITIQSGAKLVLTGGTLQVSGTISTVGTFSVTGGTIEINGSSIQTMGANLFANNTINNFTVTNPSGVSLGGTLKIMGIAKPASGNILSNGFLTLLSTVSQTALIDASGTGSVNGTTIVQRYIAKGFGYKYLSSPFNTIAVGAFSSYINLTATFPTFYSYNENVATAGWTTDTAAANSLSQLKGYAANFGTSLSPVTVSISGIVNNGILSTTLFNHNNTFTLGFNLVGNPYPSPIDWNATSGWTKTNIDNAIYYFNASDTSQYTGSYSSYIGGVSSDGIANNIIPAVQGFFVHVSNGTYPVTGTLAVNNNIRLTTLNPVFHKVAATQVPLLRIDAGLSNDGTHSDPAVIYYDEKANGTFDNTIDALKLLNTDSGIPSLYSFSPDVTKLSIQAINFAGDSTNVIPLGLQTQQDGQVTFTARNIDDMPSGMHIYFYDVKTGSNQDLQSAPQYHVNLNSGTYDNRFFLMLTNKDKGQIPVINGALNAYTSGKSLFVYLLNGTGNIVITDLLGQVIEKQEISGTGYHEVKLQVSTGIYIATLYSDMGKQSKKIFIGN